MILDILKEKLGLNDRELQAVDQWLKNIQRDGYTLANQSTTTGNSRGVQAGNVQISLEEGITLRNPSSGARTVYLDPDGDAWFGRNIELPEDTSLIIFSNDNNYNSEAFGAGDVLLGDNSAGKANLLWDRSTGKLNLRSGTIEGILLDTDGTLIVGATPPNIIIDGVNKNIRSSNFSGNAAGFQLSAVSGDAEFNNVTIRGSIKAAVFEYATISAIGGHLMLSKNASTVATTVMSTVGTDSVYIYGQNKGSVAFAAVGDILHCKFYEAGSIYQLYYTVSSVGADVGGVRLYELDYEAGNAGATILAGTAMVNYGTSGGGKTELMAYETPRLQIATHAGAPWTTWATQVVIGDMYGTYNAGANHRYGIGIGDYSSGNYLSYNAETANKFEIVGASGSMTLGDTGFRSRATAGGNITIMLDADGDAFFGSNVAFAATTAFAVFANAQSYNAESMGAGDVLLGDNSSSKANVLWDKSTGKLLFRGGVTTQAYVDTDGSIKAGGGKVVIDSAGLNLWQNAGASETRIRWRYDHSGTPRIIGGLYGKYAGSGIPEQWLYSYRATGDPWSSTKLILGALDAVGGTDAVIYLDSSGVITLDADTVHVSTGDLYTDIWQDYSTTSNPQGWASFTTKQVYYKKIGNLVYVWFRIIGTSGTTVAQFTLPYAVKNVMYMAFTTGRGMNGGTWLTNPILIWLGPNSTLVNMYSTMAAALWSASGTKEVHGHFTYETT